MSEEVKEEKKQRDAEDDMFLVDEEAQALQSSMEREGRSAAAEGQALGQPSAGPLRERRRWWSSVP